MSELSVSLPKEANAPLRSTAFKIGNVPVRIDYSIKNGNYVVDEKSMSKVVNILLRKKKVSKRAIGNVSTLTKRVNSALAGSKRADLVLQKILNKLG